MNNEILDEDLEKDYAISAFEASKIGLALMVLGLLFLAASNSSYGTLQTSYSGMCVLAPPCPHSIVLNLFLGISFFISGLLLNHKKEITYYFITGIVSSISTYSMIVYWLNRDILIQGFSDTFIYLIINVFLILYLNSNKGKINKPKLLYTFIISGLFLGIISFLIKI